MRENLLKMCVIFYYLVIFSISGCIAFPTGNLSISPINAIAKPGDNITFVCKSSSTPISTFHWKISNRDGVVLAKLAGNQVNRYTIQLVINNVGVSPELDGYNTIECFDEENHDGTSLQIGYPPVSPELECLMQDLDVLHCRANSCGSSVAQRYNLEQNMTISYRTTHYTNHVEEGTCQMKKITPCSFSCICLSEKHKVLWQYFNNLTIYANNSNQMGQNSSQILFTPRENVKLSPPDLEISESSNSNGVNVTITAKFKPDVYEKEYFNYCEKYFMLEVLYVKWESNSSFHVTKTSDDNDFWNEWHQYHNTTTMGGNMDMMSHADRVTEWSKKISLPFLLPGDTLYRFKARWKPNSTSCNGIWSTYTYITHKTKKLGPPSFYQTALFFFENGTNLYPSIFKNDNITSSSLILWKHSNESYIVHKNTEFKYEIYTSSDSDKCRINYTSDMWSNFVRLNMQPPCRNCQLQLSASNDMGVTHAPYVAQEPEDGNCVFGVHSIHLISLVKFRVDWFCHCTNLSKCDEDPLKEQLNFTLFIWKENCTNCTGTIQERLSQKIPAGAIRHHFTIDLVNYVETGRELQYDIGFRSLSMSPHSIVTYPFQNHTAYKIAVSLAKQTGGIIHQSPSVMSKNLYYTNVARPTGSTPQIYCSEVGENYIKVTWRHLQPQDRNGPLLGYKLYYTSDEKCSMGHDTATCGSPYGTSQSCREKVKSVTLTIGANVNSANITKGWVIEEDNSVQFELYTLTELDRGTNYYISILAYNAAGKSKCFRHFIQATRGLKMYVIAPIILSILLLCLFVTSLILYCKRKSCLGWRAVPQPTLQVSMDAETSDDCTYACTEYALPVNGTGSYVSLTEKEPRRKLLQYHVNENNNLSEEKHILSQNSLFDNSDISSYVIGAAPEEKNCIHESNGSVESDDQPGCSTPSTGNDSLPSTFCEDSDAMDSDSDGYTTPEAALMLCEDVRLCVEAIHS